MDDPEPLAETLRFMATCYVYAARRTVLEQAANKLDRLQRELDAAQAEIKRLQPTPLEAAAIKD